MTEKNNEELGIRGTFCPLCGTTNEMEDREAIALHLYDVHHISEDQAWIIIDAIADAIEITRRR